MYEAKNMPLLSTGWFY